MAATSYNYRGSTSNVAVANTGTLLLPWPFADSASGNVDTANAQVIVKNQILGSSEYTLTWTPGIAGANGTIAILNSTGASIPPQTSVVVVAPAVVGALTSGDISELTALASGAIPAKGGFWKDLDTPDPNVYRLRDRVFIGGAVLQHDNRAGDNTTYWPNAAAGPNWGARDSALAAMQERGAIAIMGGVRASDGDAVSPNPAPIAVAGFVDNDTTVSGKNTWALYGDVRHHPAAGVIGTVLSFGLELALKNQAASYMPNPYALGAGVHGIWLQGGGDASYGGASSFPVTSGLTFRKGGNTFNVGIAFGADAIQGSDGTTGAGIALSLARGHIIRWYQPPDGANPGASIRSDVDTSGQAVSQVFDDNVVQWLNNGNARMLQATAVASGVNFINITQAVAGAGATISAAGTDTDILLNLAGKGAYGVAALGQLTLAAPTTDRASMLFVTGSAPSSPVDGQMWREDNTNTGLKIRVNGVTKTVTLA